MILVEETILRGGGYLDDFVLDHFRFLQREQYRVFFVPLCSFR